MTKEARIFNGGKTVSSISAGYGEQYGVSLKS